MSTKDTLFIGITILSSAALFILTFWLGFPGYFQTGDIYNSLSITTNHWHPVFIARFLQCLYFLFGEHSYYLFALNIFCYYAGFAFFIIGGYLRWRSVAVYLLFSCVLIGNIFFQNFVQYHSFTFPMLLWLGCSLVYFQIVASVANRPFRVFLQISTFTVFSCALLWRHNAILSIYPLFVIFVYLFLKNYTFRSLSRYGLVFLCLMIGSAVTLVAVVKSHPSFLSNNVQKATANHIFLHQIAGMVVPAGDDSLIPPEWYEKNKDFSDVVEMYKKYPVTADPFNVGWEPYNSNRPFKRGELPRLQTVWIEAIVSYPGNYLTHISRYFKEMWFQQPGWIFEISHIQRGPSHPWHVKIASMFPENERKITFTPLQKKIYVYLFHHKLLVNHIIAVVAGFFILFTSISLWVFLPRSRSDLLMFSLGTSLSACFTAAMLCLFTPHPDPRYMSPVVVLSLISLTGFISFLSESFTERN